MSDTNEEDDPMDVVIHWLGEQMALELAMREHQFWWGIPCGPVLAMVKIQTIQELAEKAYPNHHPTTALANYMAGHEIWDSNGDHW